MDYEKLYNIYRKDGRKLFGRVDKELLSEQQRKAAELVTGVVPAPQSAVTHHLELVAGEGLDSEVWIARCESGEITLDELMWRFPELFDGDGQEGRVSEVHFY